MNQFGASVNNTCLCFPLGNPCTAICSRFYSPVFSSMLCACCLIRVFFATPGGLSHITCTDCSSWAAAPAYFSIHKRKKNKSPEGKIISISHNFYTLSHDRKQLQRNAESYNLNEKNADTVMPEHIITFGRKPRPFLGTLHPTYVCSFNNGTTNIYAGLKSVTKTNNIKKSN